MKLIIRQLGPDDVDAFREIRLEALSAHPEAYGSAPEEFAKKTIDEVAKWLASLVVFGAFDGEELVAIAAYYQEEGSKVRHGATVVAVYAAPKARGFGVSRTIIEKLAEHATSNGIIQLYLGVGARNLPAKKSYRKAGFETYGVEPRSLFVNGKYIDEELMVRFLDEAPKGNKE